MENPYFIVNPAAGGGACEKKFALVRARMKDRGIPYTTAYSEGPGHASQMARAAASGYGCIVAVGGDGTVREIAQELLYTGVPLGILPFGTGNDFIKALGIPEDPEDALSIILNGEPQLIDAASANNIIYINVAGFGLDVSVLQKTERFKRRVHGGFAYILGLIHALVGLRSYYVRIKSPEICLEKEVILMAVGNGTHVGGGMMVTPEAGLSDGLLDICLIGSLSRRRIIANFSKLIKGTHLVMDAVEYFKAAELTVECVPPALLQLDGEIIGETPVTFRVLPGALTVLRPRHGTDKILRKQGENHTYPKK